MLLREAGEYPTPCNVVGVTICNFMIWTEKDESGRFKVPMLSRWRMQEPHSGEVGSPQVQYAFLELPKYAAGEGLAEGKAATVLAILSRRNLPISAKARARIEGCQEVAMLDRWIARAANAASVEEVIAAPAKPHDS